MVATAVGTRAVSRFIQQGEASVCAGCGEPVKFSARKRGAKKVLANVYGRDGDPNVWDRTETFHESCYEEAGEPHGKIDG